MKIYLVGGAVRDKLLGLPVKERDYVVVGAHIDEMLKQGYRQVGKEFPVFLHPRTHEEYALARMERKIHAGYTGFTFDSSPDVQLETDLERRDLTINAMAETEDGVLIDPYHGKKDLQAKILRHVSASFAEDPVRILRVGRFLARYAHLGFRLAPETLALMITMVEKGEVNALVAERVWKELQRALGEKNPEKFFEVLSDCHALPILFPHLTPKGHGISALTAASSLTEDKMIRLAAVLHALPEEEIATLEQKRMALIAFRNRYKIPNHYYQLASLTSLYHHQAQAAHTLSARELLNLFTTLDVFRRGERFQQFLIASHAIARIHDLPFDKEWLIEGMKRVKSFDVRALIQQGKKGIALTTELKNARLKIIEDWIKE